jgi:uncharacterized protein (DUF1499 family)
MKRLMVVMISTVMMAACSGTRPTNLGVKAGGLVPCPGTPNCVVTNDQDTKHYIEPIVYACDQTVAFNVLKDVVAGMKRTEIVDETPLYLRLECKTKVFGFVDDVEFFFPNDSLIYMRSASRVGVSDLGVNRRRMEKIRALFEEKIQDVNPIDTSREEYIEEPKE